MYPIENEPSARIQYRRIGELQLPAQCYVCGNSGCEEGYLDFGTFVDYHGAFYLCVTCFMQGARLLRLFTPEEVETQVSLQEDLLAEIASLTLEVKTAHEYVDNANRMLSSHFSVTAANDGGLPATPTEQSLAPVIDASAPFAQRSARGESKPSEPTPLGRRKHSARVATRDTASE